MVELESIKYFPIESRKELKQKVKTELDYIDSNNKHGDFNLMMIKEYISKIENALELSEIDLREIDGYLTLLENAVSDD